MTEEKDWIKDTEKEIEKIKSWKISDRLSIISKLTFMNGGLASSVTGWHTWFTNPSIMEKLSLEELKQLSIEFEKITIQFLELDIKYTNLVKEKEKEKQVSKEETKKKEIYLV